MGEQKLRKMGKEEVVGRDFFFFFKGDARYSLSLKTMVQEVTTSLG